MRGEHVQTDDDGTFETGDRVIHFERLNSCCGVERIPPWYCPRKALPDKPKVLIAPIDLVVHASGFMMARAEVPATGAKLSQRSSAQAGARVLVEETDRALIEELTRRADRATGGRHSPCRVTGPVSVRTKTRLILVLRRFVIRTR